PHTHTSPTQTHTLSLHDALPICEQYSGLNTSSMERAFSRITEQARNQYVLGYISTNEPKGGLQVLRTIEVKGRDTRWKITYRREDRKSTRLNSSHQIISYAVFCL